jgi:hypothetical protein
VRAYVGETRAKKMRAMAVDAGCGLVVQRGRVGKAAVHLWPSYFYDNLAFADWRAGREFDAAAFASDIVALAQAERRPDFCVLPDRVAGGLASLAMSLAWLMHLECTGLTWALAVQDGMTPADIPWHAPFGVVFVGGSLQWKKGTAVSWVRAAHAHGKTCHIGRVGNKDAVRWAFDIRADSSDTSQCLWSEENFSRYRGALTSGRQQTRWEW